ncbi:hypothetical protein [Nitrospirillum pindoramense]|uniref:Uncharacterized protein n=1 Tax=Nitrospirillum amazonense TaxID=28077 RepID=A0A560GKP8_9PROT|nr:hypothetical protein [Nitrospirillum amazonense]TWB34568.1 hypothetical protein FBZ90_12538 [Nitrospirillum amazonense]
MKKMLPLAGVALVILCAAGTLASPAQPDAACAAPLAAMTRQWDEAGFQAPAKPAQIYVVGKAGRQVSEIDYAFLKNQLVLASRECDGGATGDALRHIAAMRHRLAQLGLAPER